MKRDESALVPPSRQVESEALGQRIMQLRKGLKLRQADIAARAGMSRTTAIRIEHGDPGRTLAQVLRYLHAMAPDVTLQDLITADLPALAALNARLTAHRVRPATRSELRDLDF